ncbi:MAG: 1-deoxy-D-xylulose-5-phosphate synthase [Thomasclavelia sp.]|nr:1-deoxy-D-xylulose-5-phosphate synthase [Thomasclavelia sp.]
MKVEDIRGPEDIKGLNEEQLNILASDIRRFLITKISKTGGHLSSNLGVVELTIALHYVFDSPNDKFLFDVGHQSYVHKILTGRAKDFDSLRKFGGISGFQKRKESIHDCFEAGHSSTALSGAIGMAVARDLNKDDYSIISIIGDASIVGGETFEALNHLGYLNNKVIVILNDNQMAITKPVGGFAEFLSNIRISDTYNHFKKNYKDALKHQGKVGSAVYSATKSVKDFFKHGFINKTIFEDFGLDYLGPVDGHNIHELNRVLNLAKENDKSVVVHVVTNKGMGYKYAEVDTIGKWHGVGPFDIKSGISLVDNKDKISWSKVVADQVELHMNKDKDIVAITPAMINGSCLQNIFKKYPNRAFDVGIAEEHAVTFMAGLSLNHKKPFLSIYSSFLQRGYDQLNHDIARMNLPCLISIDRSGIVGNDGPTHNGVFDIGFITPLPNIILFTPKDAVETKQFINTAFKDYKYPYIMRIPKGCILNKEVSITSTLKIGTWTYEHKDENPDICIISYSYNLNRINKALKDTNIKYCLINARFIKPMDNNMLIEIAAYNTPIVVYETDIKTNSLGYQISSYYMNNEIKNDYYSFGINDHYSKQGSINEVLKDEHLDMATFKKRIEEIVSEKGKN